MCQGKRCLRTRSALRMARSTGHRLVVCGKCWADLEKKLLVTGDLACWHRHGLCPEGNEQALHDLNFSLGRSHWLQVREWIGGGQD